MIRTTLTLAFVLTCTLIAPADAAVLEVGPGEKYDHPNKALADAQAGDTIRVWPGTYAKVALYVDKPRLTIEAAEGDDPVVFSGKGFDYSGRGRTPRAIVQFNKGADHGAIVGIELTGASNGSHNGAGVRINQANHVRVERCHVHTNDMGIMSNGDGSADAGVGQLIVACHIHHNGNLDDPGYNHNLYLGGDSVALMNCHVHHATTGHNVKSRAHHTILFKCFIHDSANREIDLVDAKETAAPESHAMLLLTKISKAPDCRGNKGVIHFGAENGEHNGTLHIINCAIETPFVSPVVLLSRPKSNAAIYNTIVYNPGDQGNQVLVAASSGASLDEITAKGNWLSRSFAAKLPERLNATAGVFGETRPPFMTPPQIDFRLENTPTDFADPAVRLGRDDLPVMRPEAVGKLIRKTFPDAGPKLGIQ